MKYNSNKTTFILFIAVLLLGSSCRKDDDSPGFSYSNLVEAELFRTRTASELQSFIEIGGIDIDLAELKYDVEIYKVVYETTYKQNDVQASGLIILPVTTEPVGMISFQHGTITTNSEAPSQVTPQSTALILYAALSSAGFVTVVPDFIGFGASSDLFHPYYVKEPTATAIVDNLKAAHQLAEQHSIDFNSKLFLAGYSQGGYATLATHQFLEENELPGFDLQASFPAAGGYDVKGMQEYFFGLETYDQPYYLAYVVSAYKEYYGWEHALTEIFNSPYAERIPELFNGTNTAGTINAGLTHSVPELVVDGLLSGIDTDPAYGFMVAALVANSLTNWKPEAAVFMYHGTADVTVPYINSTVTYDKFIDNGASSTSLTLISLEGSDHGTGVLPYIEKFVPVLLELR